MNIHRSVVKILSITNIHTYNGLVTRYTFTCTTQHTNLLDQICIARSSGAIGTLMKFFAFFITQYATPAAVATPAPPAAETEVMNVLVSQNCFATAEEFPPMISSVILLYVGIAMRERERELKWSLIKCTNEIILTSHV